MIGIFQSKLWAYGLSFICFLFPLYPVHASDQFEIGDVLVMYDGGYFDADRFTGDITDVRFYENGQPIAYADHFAVRHRKRAGDVVHLEQFLLEGLRVRDDGFVMTIDRVSIEGSIFGNEMFDMDFWDTNEEPDIYYLGEVSLDNLQMNIEGSEIALDQLVIDNFPLMPFQSDTIPDYEGGFILKGLVFDLNPNDPELMEFHTVLAQMGLQDITINAKAITSHLNKGDRYHQKTSSNLELVGLGELELYSDVEILKTTFTMMDQFNYDNDDPVESLLMLSTLGGGFFINYLEVTYQDQGLMGFVMNAAEQTMLMDRNQISDLILDTLTIQFMAYPDVMTSILPPMERFLKRGGKIVASVEPGSSLPLISLIAQIQTPEDAIRVFDFKLSN
jgi:hypothetical protein